MEFQASSLQQSPRRSHVVHEGIPLCTALIGLMMCTSLTQVALAVDYSKDIKPLLAKKCVSCHGPLKQEAGLRLDAAKFILQGGDSGAVINRDLPAGGLLLDRVTSSEDRMPPEGEGEPLSPEQVELLRSWISAGTPAPEHEDVITSPLEHWAFQPVRRPELPSVRTRSGSTNPVDLFLEEAQLKSDSGTSVLPVPQAEPEVILRRLYIDLIGLPPTRTELLEFREKLASGVTVQKAFHEVTEALLSSPKYGERWARHWMDVWRYSDWDGYRNELRGSQRHLWRWRDWIVESLNQDKGYDQMVVEMLAADEATPEDKDALRATGFLARHHYTFNRDMWLDNCIEHTSKAFLGLTVNCSKCHDHKYDPIPQQDYYQLRAFFEPYNVRIDQVPGEADTVKDGLTRAFDKDLAATTFVFERGDEKKPLKDQPLDPALPELFQTSLEISPVELPTSSWYPAVQEFIGQEAVSRAVDRLRKLENTQTTEMNDQQRAVHELKLGVARVELESIRARANADRAVASVGKESEDYRQLALTALTGERQLQVAQAELGVQEGREALSKLQGDSSTAEDKLKKAEADLAAAEKKLDEAKAALEKLEGQYTPLAPEYPQKSTGRRLALARWIVERDNPLAARVAVNHIWLRHFGTPLVNNVFDFGLRTPQPKLHRLLDWLASEFMDSGWSMKHIHRLIVSSRAYQLSSSFSRVEQPAARNLELDPDNGTFWHANIRRMEAEVVRDAVLYVSGSLDQSFGGPDLDFEKGEEIPRRSLYFRHAYEKQMTMLLLFDAASPNECYERKESIVPQQALALFNSQLANRESAKAAEKIVHELEGADPVTPETFTISAYEHLLSRGPTPAELNACISFLQTAEAGQEGTRRAELIHVLINHNDFITIR